MSYGKKSSRLIAAILCVLMVAAMMPLSTFAEEDNFTFTENSGMDWEIYVGGIGWKVIGNDMDNEKWLMLSTEAIGDNMSLADAAAGAATVYNGFSELEQKIVLGTYKTEGEGGSDLKGDKLFLPSIAEAELLMPYASDRLPGNWWLRDTDADGNGSYIADNGTITAGGADELHGARYEFQVDLKEVADVLPARGGRGSEADGSGKFGRYYMAWSDSKLALHDPAMDEILLYTDSDDMWSVYAAPGETFNLNYNILEFGDNDYIVAAIYSKTGNPMYIASIKVDPSGGGVWTLTLPDDDYSGQCELRVWREKINGDYQTNYVSNPFSIPVYTDGSGVQPGVLTRIAGDNRYDTAIQAAESVRELLSGPGSDKFASVVIASGKDFPDALAGSYLSYVRGAPILLADEARARTVAAYLQDTLRSDGKVYILGGTGAVPTVMETELKAVGIGSDRIVRLAGANRYATNIEILKEASGPTSSETEINVLVCSGKNFADALSASAVGWPILLVGDRLTDAQKKYLQETPARWYFHIIGGTGAVNSAVEAELDSLARSTGGGVVGRLAGANRYETSRKVAVMLFSERDPRPDTVVLAYGKNFPDGLSGAPVAFCSRAPLLLATTENISEAISGAKYLGASRVVVMGGPTLISDEAALKTVQ